ncbi:MAG: hypothetical protein KKC14_01420 [Alphaproteobacteria bacterium]|nr:hypothetical protein [Alphaproteobacteria bacterium]
MRSIVLIAALVSVATVARAEEARESRYGPGPDRRAAALSAAYAGPILGWAGKSGGVTTASRQSPPLIAPSWSRMGSAAPSMAQPPQAAPAPQVIAASPSSALAPNLSRTYSVGRQYGLQPDALPPLQPNGMVFIAPSEDAPRQTDEEPRHGSAEWLAGAARGDEDADRAAGKDGSL